MKSKKQLSEMTLDELYVEKRLSDDTFPSVKNTQNTEHPHQFFFLFANHDAGSLHHEETLQLYTD